MKRALLKLGTALLVFAVPGAADGQFSATHTQINVAGTFNGFETLNPNMQVVGPDVWQAYISLTNQTSVRFKFATPNFTVNDWGENTTTPFNLPIFRTATARGNDIFIAGRMDSTFKFQFNASSRAYNVQNVGRFSTETNVWINEFHYDNAGSDTNEGVEIAGLAGTDLSAYQVRFVNGNGLFNSPNINLSGTIPNQTNGYGAVWFPRASILNGRAAILLQTTNDTVLQFISYEGVVTGATQNVLGVVADPIPVDEDPESSVPAGQSLQVTGSGTDAGSFRWIGPLAHSRGLLNAGQRVVPSRVLSTNGPALNPAVPEENQAVHVSIVIVPLEGASNLVTHLLYRTSPTGKFTPIRMTNSPGNTFTTSQPIPGQPKGTRVDYYVHCLFDGGGTNSPTTFPAGAPTTNAAYGISRVPFGAVWINEINYVPDFGSPNTNEFVEIAGKAGLVLGGLSIELLDASSGAYARYTFPEPTLLANDAAGHGVYVVGDSGVPNLDLAFTNTYSGDSSMATRGAIRLLSEFGFPFYTLTYGDPQPTNFGSSAIYMGIDDEFKFEDESISLVGSGSNFAAFVVSTTAVPTPGTVNAGQTLTGGNTNPVPPGIVCPPNPVLQCLADVPAPNTNDVIAVGYCGDGSVTVTLISNVNNGASGCFGSPRIITRVYRAVSACASTNTCTQTLRVEDTTPPSVDCNAQGLADSSFEDGDLGSWTVFGSPGEVEVATQRPRTGLVQVRIAITNQAAAQAGLHQTLPATAGENWLAAAYFGQPSATPLAGANAARTQLQFLNSATQVLQTAQAVALNAAAPRDLYLRGMVQATAPAGTAFARLRLFVDQAAPDGAAIDVEDAVLSPVYALSTNGTCSALTPSVTAFAIATDNCSTPIKTQSPAAGTPLPVGEHLIRVTATDCGGLSNSCFVAGHVIDMTLPTLQCPSNLTVATIGEVPAPSPGSVVASDDCGTVTVLHLGDSDNGGAGTAENPLVISRSYLAADVAGNTNVCVQTITVNGGSGGSTQPVEIVRLRLLGPTVALDSLGTNTLDLVVQYNTNLVLTPQNWFVIPSYSNIYSNGTNYTTFPVPDTNRFYLFFRAHQE